LDVAPSSTDPIAVGLRSGGSTCAMRATHDERKTAMTIRPPRGLAPLALALTLAAPPAYGASHREAPLMTLDPAADITDVYAFVSYDAANLARAAGDRKATLILNVIPAQEPSSGPNYFAFDDNVLYEIHVDNDKDGDAE